MMYDVINDKEIKPIEKKEPVDLEALRLKRQSDMLKKFNDGNADSVIEEVDEEETETISISYGHVIKVEKKDK